MNDDKTKVEQNRKHVKAVDAEQEQVRELMRRGAIRHYFLGQESIWTQEGFGTVVGGSLSVLFGGLVLPKLFLYSSSDLNWKYVCWVIVAVGIVLIGKGFFGMAKEARSRREPVPDKVHDEILNKDIEDLKKRSKELLREKIPKLARDEAIDDMESILVKGPRDYVHNVNLPLQYKLGSDGVIRYSNFSVMVFYFGEDNLYIYTSIFNMRNGTSKFEHAYECPYEDIHFADFQNRTVETVTQQNKAVTQELQFFVVNAGSGENDELAIPVQDFDLLKSFHGTFDISDSEQAREMIQKRMKGMNQN